VLGAFARDRVRVFEDIVSGRTFDRPGDTLAVIRLDRLGRPRSLGRLAPEQVGGPARARPG